MPRGVPKERPEEVPMRFTSFWIPAPMNSKNAASNYLKSDSQTLWSRNAANGTAGGQPSAPEVEVSWEKRQKRGSDIIIIHPGTRFLRVGRATDAYPINIPHVIARKTNLSPTPPPSFIRAIPPFKATRSPSVSVSSPESGEPLPDDYAVSADPDDPLDQKIGAIRLSLRARMFSYGFSARKNGSSQAEEYNKNVQVIEIPDHKDQDNVEWLDSAAESKTIVGSKARPPIVFRIPDPVQSKYLIRWPIRGSKFNQVDYATRQELIGDIQSIWTTVLQTELSIDPPTFKNLSVILVVPDYWDKFYVRDLAHLLLVQMGFRRMCIQQESICASFGAGIAAACVVDIGAAKTSVSCIEEGLVLPDTRISLDYGGDDISEFFHLLLARIGLPYKEADLSRLYDWNMIEDLKTRSATLAEVDVDLITYDLFVRAPARITEKYSIKTYDEPNVASMILFHPSIIDFENKHASSKPIWTSDCIDEMDTQAMVASTAHLHPEGEMVGKSGSVQSSSTNVPDSINVTEASSTVPKTKTDAGHASPDAESNSKTPRRTESPEDPGRVSGTGGVGVSTTAAVSAGSPSTGIIYRGGTPIDIRSESSKQPLDHAIFHSIRACAAGTSGVGANERLKKMLACILVVGGTALTPGMLHALESRVKGLVAANMPGQEELVAVIPAPKEIDPRVLAWKGVAVLSKLESLSDLWIQQADWDMMGMRALKERSFFL
ncbi:hypothetical protein BS47DRAFT_1370856 [Hydnum rufescens UP504]|uniref:Actin-related protein 8 n=1 Tax=Hydnum rufescens UP504 TaxID=1448309 RepID=A0A9P6E167_9AGAM|nr:hypothetical protein BS47DRAFT_1370856 [Hydnum rufescens UP504]